MTRNPAWHGPTDPGFAAQVSQYPGAEKIQSCMQCGVCSGSCPMGEAMPEPPRRIIGHVLAGDRERALNSEAIWYCASCFSCAVRCPQGISITDVMYALRSLAAPAHKNVSTTFYKTFTNSVVQGGRAHEAGVAMAAGFARGPKALLGLAPMGMGLMLKGRMHLAKPKPIKATDELATLARAVELRRPKPVVRPVREDEHS